MWPRDQRGMREPARRDGTGVRSRGGVPMRSRWTGDTADRARRSPNPIASGSPPAPLPIVQRHLVQDCLHLGSSGECRSTCGRALNDAGFVRPCAAVATCVSLVRRCSPVRQKYAFWPLDRARGERGSVVFGGVQTGRGQAPGQPVEAWQHRSALIRVLRGSGARLGSPLINIPAASYTGLVLGPMDSFTWVSTLGGELEEQA